MLAIPTRNHTTTNKSQRFTSHEAEICQRQKNVARVLNNNIPNNREETNSFDSAIAHITRSPNCVNERAIGQSTTEPDIRLSALIGQLKETSENSSNLPAILAKTKRYPATSDITNFPISKRINRKKVEVGNNKMGRTGTLRCDACRRRRTKV